MIVHHDSSLNISDVFEAIENTDPDYRQITANNTIDQNNTTMNRTGPGGHYTGARIVIVEQPASKAMRFRYECEGRSAGSIPGQNSTPENKTFPTIRVEGYKGKAVVVVSCVTKDEPYRPHPHNLVGKEGCKEGVCTIEIPVETMTVTFSNLGIRCVKKKDIDEALQKRERIRVDPFRTKFAHRNQPSSIDLNAVRLCFQVFLEEKGKFSVPLEPVVSEPIYDKKANTDLQIFQLSSSSSSVAGGKKVLLFCEKVTKDDIAVKFFEQRDNQIVWEGLADFQPSDVHRQVGIAFTTPRYQNLEVSEPVDVYIQLFRPSDRVTSDPLPFQFKPLEKEADMKRKRPCSDTPINNYYKVDKLQRDSSMGKQASSFGLMNLKVEPTIKVEPRDTHNRLYGGGMSPRSTNAATIEAMSYRLTQPISISPGTSPSPIYHHQDNTFGGTVIHNPNQLYPQTVLNTLASPSGSITPSNSMDGFGRHSNMTPSPSHMDQWNLPPTRQDFNTQMQWNIGPQVEFTQQQPQQQQQQQQTDLNQWATFGQNSESTATANVASQQMINDLNDPSGLSVLDLDSQELRQCGENLPQLNSTELAENLHVFETQLSENLSNNLILTDNNQLQSDTKESTTSGNLTDSGYTLLTASTINAICNLNEMCKTNQIN